MALSSIRRVKRTGTKKLPLVECIVLSRKNIVTLKSDLSGMVWCGTYVTGISCTVILIFNRDITDGEWV